MAPVPQAQEANNPAPSLLSRLVPHSPVKNPRKKRNQKKRKRKKKQIVEKKKAKVKRVKQDLRHNSKKT